MQRSVRNSYNENPRNIQTRYRQNGQWNQNFRPQGPSGFRGSGSRDLRKSIQNFDYQHWCETCDKGFPTARFLENHKLQHQKCNIDGCQFVAHPKIITKHIQMQHSTGLFKRIAKLNNPEDIKKWREERKKKYPTIENIKKKVAAINEKISRGEKMGIRHERSRRNEKSGFQQKTNNNISQTNRMRHSQGKYNKNLIINRKRVATDLSKKTEIPKKICKTIPPMEETRKLLPFAGIQSIEIDNDDVDEEIAQCSDSIEDDEDIHNAYDTIQKANPNAEPTVCTALSSLMCCYGSSDEEDNEMRLNVNEMVKQKDDKIKIEINNLKNNDKVNKSRTNLAETMSPNINELLQSSKNSVLNIQNYNDYDSGPEEAKIIREEIKLPVDKSKVPVHTMLKQDLSSKQVIRAPKRVEFRKRNKLPSTLIEKLLHREIQHERNVILQCVRYVIHRNYFENT